jgi:hypothetical protein
MAGRGGSLADVWSQAQARQCPRASSIRYLHQRVQTYTIYVEHVGLLAVTVELILLAVVLARRSVLR